MMKKIVLLSFLLSVCGSYLFAQQIGEWITYPAIGTFSSAEDDGNQVFFLSGSSLFSYDKQDNSVLPYSKNEGLSDAQVEFIAYDPVNKGLIIIYQNQNIDILIRNQVFNLPDLKDKVMTGEKKVNGVFIHAGKAYLATSFGCIIIDIARKEISESFNIGEHANYAFLAYDNYCLVQNSGILACPVNENAYDRSNWSRVTTLKLTDAYWSGETLHGITDDKRAVEVDRAWNPQTINVNKAYDRIKAFNGEICFLNAGSADIITPKGSFTIPSLPGVSDITSSRENEYWFCSADGLFGLKRSGNEFSVIQERILPEGPLVRSAYNMEFRHDKLYITTGGPFRIPTEDVQGNISILSDGSWSNIAYRDVIDSGAENFTRLLDIRASETDPNQFFVSNFTHGIFQFENNKLVKNYTDINGELGNLAGSGRHFWISAMDMDRKGNLWIANSLVEDQIRMRTVDGKWYKYKVPGLGKVEEIRPMLATRNGKSSQKWMLSYYISNFIIVFDENGTYDNMADDKSVYYQALTDQDGNSYPVVFYRDVVEDLDGKIWIGTSVGPFVLNNPQTIYQSPQCTRIKIPRNDGTGLADYLLDNVTVTCMAVDAANRKWIGTSGSGVYLLSEDGMKTIHHFTSANSPLTSDEILSMKIDHATGKVFFGCLGGLVSYQSDAVTGSEDYSSVYAYPNPVHPEHTGPITITGLMDRTLVKITDLNNNLIYQGNSLGGQCTWDGLNHRGDRVKSGVYLVYGTSEDGKQGVVTKVMIIR